MICQVCESDELIVHQTRIGHLCERCMAALKRIATSKLRDPTADDAMKLRAELKA